MYDKVSTNFEFVNREKKVLDFWNENHIFEKSIDSRKNAETFTFYDGPPTANGKPHIGHVLTRVIKDMIPRYKTMKGYMVPRKAGWDTHGLPVEIEVEKLLGKVPVFGICLGHQMMSKAAGAQIEKLTSPMTTPLSSPSGGRSSRFGIRACSIRASR